jgi:hypothetical protein
MTPDAILGTEEQPRSRTDLADRLVARVGRIQARLGDVTLAAHEGWDAEDKTLRRLGDLILRLVWGFDEHYPRRPVDPLACVLGRVDIPRESYADDLLLDFYERFKAIQEGVPARRLCNFRQDQRRRLRRRQLDLLGAEPRQRYASNPGFLRQADLLREAEAARDRTPRCAWCEQLGDTILSLQAGRGVALVTADRTFLALGGLLAHPVVLLPSLAELKRREAEEGTGAIASSFRLIVFMAMSCITLLISGLYRGLFRFGSGKVFPYYPLDLGIAS